MIFRSDVKKILFYYEIDETLEHVAQTVGGCCIPGNIEGLIEWDSEQPNLVEDVPVYCKGFELGGL